MRFAPLLALAAACTFSGTPDLASLTELGGCADLLVYAVDADDELLLSVWAEGLVAAAQEAGVETSEAFALPDDAVLVTLEQGRQVSDATCDDVIENGGPEVDRTWLPTSGTLTVTVRPGADLSEARADVTLEDVVFEDGDESVTLDAMSWTDVSVGWFAG